MENKDLKNDKINKFKKVGKILCYVLIVLVWVGVVVLWFSFRGCSMLSASAETNQDTIFDSDALYNDAVGGLDFDGVKPLWSVLNGVSDTVEGGNLSSDSSSVLAPYGDLMNYMGYYNNLSCYQGDYVLDDPMAKNNLYANIFTVSHGVTSSLMNNTSRVILLGVSDKLLDGSYVNTIYRISTNSRTASGNCYLDNGTLAKWVSSMSDIPMDYTYLHQYISISQSSLRSYKASQYYLNLSGDNCYTAILLPIRNDIVERTYSFYLSNIDVYLYWYQYDTTSGSLWNDVSAEISKTVSDNRTAYETIVSNSSSGGSSGGIDYEWAYNDLLGKYQELNARYDTLSTINSNLNSQLASLQIQIDTLNAEVGSFGLQTQQYKDRILSLESQLDTFRQSLRDYSDEIDRLETLVDGFELDYSNLPHGYDSIADYVYYVDGLEVISNYYGQEYPQLLTKYQALERDYDVLLDSIENDVNKESASYKSGYSQGYRDGKSYEETKAIENQETIKNSIVGIISAPVDFFSDILNFSILGVNVFDFLTAIITLLLTVWVIKTFI